MGLEIKQTYAKVGIERTPSNLQMQSRFAMLELHQKHAKVNIHTELPKVEIDSYEARASAGLKNDADLLKEAAQLGKQQAMAYIGKVAEDGNRFAAIEKGGNPIAEMAVRDAYPQHEFGLDYIPKVGPKITVKGSIQYDPEKNGEGVNNGVEGKFIPGSLYINYTPAKVNIYLKQYASINITYRNSKIDSSI